MESEVIKMSIQCEKLSPLIPIDEEQNLNTYLNKLYPLYFDEIAVKQFYFHGKPISVFTDLNCDLRHQTFEHLTTKGSDARSYNLKRCERILWIRDILSNICEKCGDYRVLYDSKWKSRAGAKRYIIWCVKEDYAIVLEERQN